MIAAIARALGRVAWFALTATLIALGLYFAYGFAGASLSDRTTLFITVLSAAVVEFVSHRLSGRKSHD